MRCLHFTIQISSKCWFSLDLFIERLGSDVWTGCIVPLRRHTNRWALQLGAVAIAARLGLSLREVSSFLQTMFIVSSFLAFYVFIIIFRVEYLCGNACLLASFSHLFIGFMALKHFCFIDSPSVFIALWRHSIWKVPLCHSCEDDDFVIASLQVPTVMPPSRTPKRLRSATNSNKAEQRKPKSKFTHDGIYGIYLRNIWARRDINEEVESFDGEVR